MLFHRISHQLTRTISWEPLRYTWPTMMPAAAAAVWASYHLLRARRGGVVDNQPFEWPRLVVWVVVCVAMVPAGGLIGLALVVFMILALAEFMPTL